jgi:hypothetical protein
MQTQTSVKQAFTQRQAGEYLTTTINLEVCEREGHTKYKANFTAKNGREYELKILPIYRSGTKSLMDFSGSARIEICEKQNSGWKLYHLCYTNVIKANRDLSGSVLADLSLALTRLGVIESFMPLSVDFKESGIARSISC